MTKISRISWNSMNFMKSDQISWNLMKSTSGYPFIHFPLHLWFNVKWGFLVITVFTPYITYPIYDPSRPIYGWSMYTHLMPNCRIYWTHKYHKYHKHVIIVSIYEIYVILWDFQKSIIFPIFWHFLANTTFFHTFL